MHSFAYVPGLHPGMDLDVDDDEENVQTYPTAYPTPSTMSSNAYTGNTLPNVYDSHHNYSLQDLSLPYSDQSVPRVSQPFLNTSSASNISTREQYEAKCRELQSLQQQHVVLQAKHEQLKDNFQALLSQYATLSAQSSSAPSQAQISTYPDVNIHDEAFRRRVYWSKPSRDVLTALSARALQGSKDVAFIVDPTGKTTNPNYTHVIKEYVLDFIREKFDLNDIHTAAKTVPLAFSDWPRHTKDELRSLTVRRFVELGWCEGDWKTNEVARITFNYWKRHYFSKALEQHGLSLEAIKTEPKAEPDVAGVASVAAPPVVAPAPFILRGQATRKRKESAAATAGSAAPKKQKRTNAETLETLLKPQAPVVVDLPQLPPGSSQSTPTAPPVATQLVPLDDDNEIVVVGAGPAAPPAGRTLAERAERRKQNLEAIMDVNAPSTSPAISPDATPEPSAHPISPAGTPVAQDATSGSLAFPSSPISAPSPAAEVSAGTSTLATPTTSNDVTTALPAQAVAKSTKTVSEGALRDLAVAAASEGSPGSAVPSTEPIVALSCATSPNAVHVDSLSLMWGPPPLSEATTTSPPGTIEAAMLEHTSPAGATTRRTTKSATSKASAVAKPTAYQLYKAEQKPSGFADGEILKMWRALGKEKQAEYTEKLKGLASGSDMS